MMRFWLVVAVESQVEPTAPDLKANRQVVQQAAEAEVFVYRETSRTFLSRYRLLSVAKDQRVLTAVPTPKHQMEVLAGIAPSTRFT
jgi:hypothetical protein